MKCVKMVPCRLDGLFKPCFFDAAIRNDALKLTIHGCTDKRPWRVCDLCMRNLYRGIKKGGWRVTARH